MADRINSKRKGNRGERDAAKFLQIWTGFEFTKTPGSGGLRWHRKRDTQGDIICSDETHSREFKFVIESKFYKDLDFNLFGRSSNIMKFWAQALDQTPEGKLPFLIMRYNGMSKGHFFIGLSPTMLAILKTLGLKQSYMIFRVGGSSILILQSDTLLKIPYLKLHAHLTR